jgi:WD40 repeat protein
MACTADGAKAATVSLKGIVRVWNLRDGTQLATTASPETEIRSIAFLDDGNTLRWGTERHQVYDWFMNDADPIETVLAGAVPTTAWDLDEKFGTSVLGFANGGILIFDRRGTPKAEFGVEGCGPAAIVRSRDGDLLLTAGGLPQMASDNTARLWRTTAPENPTAIFIGDAPFTAAALSRDGRQAVLGDATGAVHFLEIVGL